MDAPHTPGDRDVRTWAMWLHLSQLAGFLVPGAGLIVPIVIWQAKKADMPALDVHGRVVANWIVSALIYAAVCVVLVFVLIGIPLLLALALIGMIFPIIGGIKASDGLVWRYPLSIRFFG